MEASEQIIALHMRALGDYLCMSQLLNNSVALPAVLTPQILEAIPVSLSFVRFAIEQYMSSRGLPFPRPASEVSASEEPSAPSGEGDPYLAELWSLDTVRTCIMAAIDSAVNHLTEVTIAGITLLLHAILMLFYVRRAIKFGISGGISRLMSFNGSRRANLTRMDFIKLATDAFHSV
jgi:hypothetical protein